jgi:hypothetical protein
MPPLSIDDGSSIGGQMNQYHKMASNLEVIEEINEDRSPNVYLGDRHTKPNTSKISLV